MYAVWRLFLYWLDAESLFPRALLWASSRGLQSVAEQALAAGTNVHVSPALMEDLGKAEAMGSKPWLLGLVLDRVGLNTLRLPRFHIEVIVQKGYANRLRVLVERGLI